MTESYAVLLDQELISVFDAASLVEAVEIKSRLQAGYNDMHGCDEVFHVRKSTRAERCWMDKHAYGYAMK